MIDSLQLIFTPRGPLDDSFVRWVAWLVAGIIVGALLLNEVLVRTGVVGRQLGSEIRRRTLSWAILAPAIGIAIVLGGGWTMLAVCLLSMVCWRELARATGVFREKLVSAAVVVTILAVLFANLDHWPRLLLAAGPLGSALVATVALVGDRPHGYLQRTALGVFGVAFCAVGLGSLGFIANDPDARPILVLLLLVTQLSDVSAYLCGKLFGRRLACPNISPRKTVEGAVGALAVSTGLVVWLGPCVFPDTPLADRRTLVGIGLLLGALAQLGDLMLSAVKRDIGIKDLGTVIPGHGGLLDRFDSLVLTAPVYFHLVSYFRGIAVDQPTGLFTGAGAGD